MCVCHIVKFDEIGSLLPYILKFYSNLVDVKQYIVIGQKK